MFTAVSAGTRTVPVVPAAQPKVVGWINEYVRSSTPASAPLTTGVCSVTDAPVVVFAASRTANGA